MAMNADNNYKKLNIEEPISMVELIKGINIKETKYSITNESYISREIRYSF
jgi:hypothetical protein